MYHIVGDSTGCRTDHKMFFLKMIIKVFPNTNELKYSSTVSRGYLQKDLLAGSFAAFLDWLQHEMVGI